MRRKGVLLLGIIACWIALCIGEEGSSNDYERDSTFSQELAEEYLMRAGAGAASEKPCSPDKECENVKETCQKKSEDEDVLICRCAEGLGGDNCDDLLACNGTFKNCNGGVNGTCGYDEANRIVTCNCDSERKLHPNEKRCRETCTVGVEEDCKNGGTCGPNGEHNFCKCKLGLIGDKCELVFDCTEKGKYKDCVKSGGECSYDGSKPVCVCKGKKKLHDKENVCKDCECGSNEECSFIDGERKCVCKTGFASKDNRCQETCTVGVDGDCKNGGTCEPDGEHNFCKCKSGLIGDKCETVFDCTKDGEYKDCEESGGKCSYDGNKAVCVCGGGKKLDDKEKVCKVCDCGSKGECSFKEGLKTCDCQTGFAVKNEQCQETCKVEVDGDCQHGGKCEKIGNDNFCNCKSGLIGDKCETVFNCTKGEYKGCSGSGGKCYYDGIKAVCECNGDKKLDDKEKVCKDCICGSNEDCSFKNSKEICVCKPGFAKKGETCEVCDCGPGGTCKFNGANPECTCNNGFKLDGAKCKECACGDNEECSFKNGKQICDCKQGFAKKDKKCEECDCGTGGTCQFNGDDPECTCKEGYALDEQTCKECDCRPGGTCEIVDGEPECTCIDGFELNGKECIECNCGPNGTCSLVKGKPKCDCEEGFSEKKGKCEACDCGSNGECSFEKNKKKCKCETDYIEKDGKCVETCTDDDDCENEGKCKGKEKEKVCVCLEGTEGEKCEKITDCETGKFSECKNSGGKCKFEGSKSTCTCPDDLSLDISLRKPICRANCTDEDAKYCKNEALCTDHFCKCPEGTEGSDCSEVIQCKTLKCEEKEATCKYAPKKFLEATCECKDPKYKFEGGECVAKWCSDACKDGTKCEYKDEVGICKCKNPKQYYDYVAKSCKEYDLCFNKTCEGQLICKGGNCECPDYKRKNGTICEDKDLCDDKNICFTGGAKCEGGSSLGYVKCLCASESSFYNPKSGECEDGSCFLNVDRKTCNKKCPKEMATRKDGICNHKKNESICDKKCGFLGYCFKDGDKERCLCDPTYAVLNKTSEMCILKADAVCPKEQLDNKCKCTGKYKQAENGITCDLKSCSDEDVQKECKDVRAAKCVDNWRGTGDITGYHCECPTGYVKDKEKGCIDPCNQDEAKDKCSSNGQLCYIGDRDRINECRCPPTFTYDETRRTCDLNGANTFMIHGLPVLKKKYETAENVINKVVLVRDISASMKQTFANLDFVHLFNLKAEKDVLICEVWLQFQSSLPSTFNATLEVQRWKAISVKANNQFLLPPNLLLSGSHFDQASEEELTLCTESVQQSFCGKGSTCKENKCSCESGFREIDATIRATKEKRITRCEDIDECTESSHGCKDNSTCMNTIGSYYCKCKPGYKKSKGDADAMNQEECISLCHGVVCGKGECQVNDKKAIDCTCQPGYRGSYCNRKDENLAKAVSSTKVVGAVLGTLLGIVIILIIVYIVRQRKNSYSEDFTPAPRIDNAEMSERRPMRGVTNRAFQ